MNILRCDSPQSSVGGDFQISSAHETISKNLDNISVPQCCDSFAFLSSKLENTGGSSIDIFGTNFLNTETPFCHFSQLVAAKFHLPTCPALVHTYLEEKTRVSVSVNGIDTDASKACSSSDITYCTNASFPRSNIWGHACRVFRCWVFSVMRKSKLGVDFVE